jgi:predicted Ser/Thr protein kinase
VKDDSDVETPFSNLGQSGSTISIIVGRDKLKRIKKKSNDKSTRFHSQYLKHKNLDTLGPQVIDYPKILSDFKDNSYEMEYINGVPLGEFLKEANHKEVEHVCEHIQNHLAMLLSESNGIIPSSQILLKLEKLLIIFHKSQPESSIFLKLANSLVRLFESVEVIKGWNHGDFSFENIIVESGSTKLFMIDLLDSPFETPLIDIGRISLDANFGWWASGFNSSSNLQLNSDKLVKHLDRVLIDGRVSTQLQNLFIGLAILRIQPYTIDPLRMAYLKYAAVQIERQLN